VHTIVCHASPPESVAWSPSGDRFAFVRVLVNVHGPAMRELVIEPLQGPAKVVTLPSGLTLTSMMPVWLPSGTGVLYGVSGGVHPLELFSMRAGGGDPVQLTDNNLDDFDPVWSPDGRRIAFARGQVDVGYTAAERSLHLTSVAQGSLYLMGAHSGHVRRLTRSGIDTMPAWSPDGRSIAFTLATTRPDGSLATQRLLTIARLGGATRALPCRPARRYYYSDADIPRIVNRAPDGAIEVSDGAAIWGLRLERRTRPLPPRRRRTGLAAAPLTRRRRSCSR